MEHMFTANYWSLEYGHKSCYISPTKADFAMLVEKTKFSGAERKFCKM
jgi:hypothetical protein